MKWVSVAVMAALPGIASAQQDLSYHFGYAMQAAMTCPALQMRVDTEDSADANYGSPVRDGDQYREGLFAVMDAGDSACSIAWQRYGCSGSVEPGLVQQNGTTVNSPQLCRYE